MNSLDKFHHLNKKGNPVSVYDFRIFEDLNDGNIFFLGGVPYIYENGVFNADLSGSKLKTEIRKCIYPEFIRSTTIERVYKLFSTAAELQKTYADLNVYPEHWINFKNGFWDPVKKEMHPHSQSYLSINQIPHEYRPDKQAEGSNVEAWLNFITPDPDDREMLLEFCGYCLTRDTGQQKFLILTGLGGSGKSTLIKLLDTVVGSKNISNVSLKELNQRFASYSLLGKLLNSCGDLEVTALEDPTKVKKILGEDPIQTEAKGKDPVSLYNYAKMIFSTNELPVVLNEKTNGFFRRVMIITMNKKPEHVDPNFINSLEIDYFIQLCVQALERMYARGLIKESENSIKSVQQFRNDSDSVEAWLNEEMVLDPEGRLERSYLYGNYSLYCTKNERQTIKKTRFFKDLRTKGFSEIKTSGSWYFRGISTKE